MLARATEIASCLGLDGLTIGRLADDVGLSKSSVFGYFGSREELQLAVFANGCELLVDKVVAPVQSKEAGAARLGALVDRYLGFLERETLPGGCLLAGSASEWDSREGPVGEAVRAAVAGTLAALEREAETAGADEPEQVALALFGILLAGNSLFQAFRSPAIIASARGAAERVCAGLLDMGPDGSSSRGLVAAV